MAQEDNADQQVRLQEQTVSLSKKNGEQQVRLADEQEKTNTVLSTIHDTLAKVFQLATLRELREKRLASIKKKEVDQKEGPKLLEFETVKVDGIEGMIGGILGAIAGIAAGFVAEVTQVYKGMILALKDIPALVKNLSKGVIKSVEAIFKAMKSGFRFIKGTLVAIFEDTKIAELFVGLKNFLIGEGSFLAEFSKDIKNLGKAYRSAFTEIKTAFKAIGSEGTLLGDIIRLIAEEAKVVKQAFKSLLGFQEIGTGVYEISATTGKITEQTKEVNRIVEALRGAFTRMIAPLKRGLDAARGASETVVVATEAFVGPMAETSSTVAKTTGRIGEFFRDLRILFTNAFEGIKALTSGLGKMKGPLGLVIEAVGSFAQGFAKVAKVLKPIGNLVGKLFVPLVVLYETITNFFSVFTDESNEAKSTGEKLLLALKGTLVGIIDELFLVPLDLVKDIISWLGGKLGFKEFEEALDGFSFSEFFHYFVDNFKEIVTQFGDWIVGEFDSFMDDPLAYAKDLITSIVKGIAGVFSSIKGLIVNAIKGVLNLIPGVDLRDDDAKRQDDFLESGVVEKKGVYGFRKNTISEDKLQSLTEDEMKDIGTAFADDENIMAQLEAEMERRERLEPTAEKERRESLEPAQLEAEKGRRESLEPAQLEAEKAEKGRRESLAPAQLEAEKERRESLAPAQLEAEMGRRESLEPAQLEAEKGRRESLEPTAEKVGTPTMQEVVSPPPVFNEVDAAYATPAQITGLAQESVAQSDELIVSQQQLDTNRQQVAPPYAAAGNSQVGIDASSSQVTNVTNYHAGRQPSSRDRTDQMYIFRATGTSR